MIAAEVETCVQEKPSVPISQYTWCAFPGRFLLCVLLSLILMTSCGGGGDGGSDNDDAASPDSTLGTASGRLFVPPTSTIEVESNDTPRQAQAIAPASRISGNAASSDLGFAVVATNQPAINVQDLYRLNATVPTRIILTIAEDNLNLNDLDLFLLDTAGNVLSVSQGRLTTEVVEAPAGEMLIGIRAFQGTSAYVLAVDTLGSNASAATVPPEAMFVPGDVLVQFQAEQAGILRQATQMASVYGLTHVASFPPGMALLRAPAPAQRHQSETGTGPAKLQLPQSEENALKALTLDTIRWLRHDPNVVYAEPNYLRQAALIPNDELFDRQWNYTLINLPAAWDITTGSDDVIVAVIDSGVLSQHPDLTPRLVPGFDFISDPSISRDDDGIDPNASDPGDDPNGHSSTFHGTHVAGTIAAVTNNTTGVTGVTWQTRIMPLRVLGIQGMGTDVDIAQAIRFAAGLPSSSGVFPAEPAHIINMSLSGPGFSATLQNAILAARQQGLIVVAAAGNENSSVLQSPASLEGVISVAAVDRSANKASYSNFGTGIDVAAPGGDISANLDGDGFPDGILSTLGDDQGNFLYRMYQGTSMATPHVAGVIALMLAVNPSLTPIDIDQLLAATHPQTTRRITRDLGPPGRDDFYGRGLIDAAAAVIAAGEIVGGSVSPTGSSLAVSPTSLDFKNFIPTLTFQISNSGSNTLTIANITADVPWLTLNPTTGTAPLAVTVNVDRTGLPEETQTATIQITSDATQGSPTATVSVRVDVGQNTQGNIGTVFVLVLNSETTKTVAQTTTDSTQDYAFTIPAIPPGTYIVVAGTDRDHDGFICDVEDACGIFSSPLTVVAGQHTPAVDFIVGDLVSLQRDSVDVETLHLAPFARLK